MTPFFELIDQSLQQGETITLNSVCRDLDISVTEAKRVLKSYAVERGDGVECVYVVRYTAKDNECKFVCITGTQKKDELLENLKCETVAFRWDVKAISSKDRYTDAAQIWQEECGVAKKHLQEALQEERLWGPTLKGALRPQLLQPIRNFLTLRCLASSDQRRATPTIEEEPTKTRPQNLGAAPTSSAAPNLGVAGNQQLCLSRYLSKGGKRPLKPAKDKPAKSSLEKDVREEKEKASISEGEPYDDPFASDTSEPPAKKPKSSPFSSECSQTGRMKGRIIEDDEPPIEEGKIIEDKIICEETKADQASTCEGTNNYDGNSDQDTDAFPQFHANPGGDLFDTEEVEMESRGEAPKKGGRKAKVSKKKVIQDIYKEGEYLVIEDKTIITEEEAAPEPKVEATKHMPLTSHRKQKSIMDFWNSGAKKKL